MYKLVLTKIRFVRSNNFMRTVAALLISAQLLYGCSGSGSSEANAPQPPASNQLADEQMDLISEADEDSTIDENPVNDDPQDSTSTPDSTSDQNAATADPLAQNLTAVEFNITVPAYMSNALQVRLRWGDREFTAQWVGDELWSASEDFPTGTEHLLTITFHDDNGAITLASFEENFRTGTNAAESFDITADQFDTERWDNDVDGVSNIDELIAGTDITAAPRILLFSETREFRHDSTATALTALEELATSVNIETDRANDSAGVFNDTTLANYAAVVWVMTSGDVLDNDEQAAFERYIRAGGGYAGIHAASFTEYEWPWYGTLVGAYFDRHPEIQSATQIVENRTHPSTSHLQTTWTRIDEWYDYRSNPRAQVNVLLSLDETSYSGGTMGSDHPSAWYHAYEGGRSWYTGGGHTEASYGEADFRAHLLGGLLYAAGLR